MDLIPPIAHLADHFARLPGIGPKTAQRLAFAVLAMEQPRAEAFADALCACKTQVGLCPLCGMYCTKGESCPVCENDRRDPTIICVVRDPRDVLAMERAHGFSGHYHVLHGVIAPMSGVGPDDIRIDSLLKRVKQGAVEEVILATDPDVEGDVTAMYIADLLAPLSVKVTRIAYGVPVGGSLEYTDDITLQKALAGRRGI